MSDAAQLDWGGAEVHEGELTVPLTGEPGEAFEHAFETTVRLLGKHADWGEVELQDGAVRVSDVQPGSEEALRHHLDSIVLQAAAAEHQEAEQAQASAAAEQAEGPDAEMTERFRAFADGVDTGDGSER